MAGRKSSNKSSDLERLNIDIGKVPPQAVELEEAVLGAIMIEKDALITSLEILKPESFYKDANRKIFEAILMLNKEKKAIDILTVKEQLKQNGTLDEVGGPLYISMLTGKIGSAAHVEFHSRIIAQKYIQRELIRISAEIQRRAFDESEDVDDLLDYSENELFNVAQGTIKKEAVPIDLIIKEAIEQIKTISKQEHGLAGIPSGFTKLDHLTSGWQKSDLIIIAARPSMGKTAFILTMARNIAVDYNRPVAIFSLEMSALQLVNRLIGSETELSSDKIKNGTLDFHEWQQLDSKIPKLLEAPIFIDDSPAISVFELRAKCRRLVAQHKVQMVIVDYLQLMSGGGDNKYFSREQEVSTISRSLKALAKELNVPVIALSQLNRSVETRTSDKRPHLSDLRESGAIEQDADMVIFIHRPEKYGLTQDSYGNSTIGLAEIIIAKHRNGPVGEVNLKFEDRFAKFTEMDSEIGEFGDDSFNIKTFKSKMNDDVDSPDNNFRQNKRFDNESPF